MNVSNFSSEKKPKSDITTFFSEKNKSMDLGCAIIKLKEEIEGKYDRGIIKKLEDIIIENIEDISSNLTFFKLPLINILSIISKIDFNQINNNDVMMHLLQDIIKNTVKAHSEEKETLLLLQNIDFNTVSNLNYEEILSLFELFTNCPILVNFCRLHKERNHAIDFDYEYELKNKMKELNELKQSLNKFEPIEIKPNKIDSNLFIACKDGNLDSVQWLVEKEYEDVNKSIRKPNIDLNLNTGDTAIHCAVIHGQLTIVEYFIEKQNVDSDIRGYNGKTLLHYACEYSHPSIFQYLLSKGADVFRLDNSHNSLIHYAAMGGLESVIKYLIELDDFFHLNKPGFEGQTPLHYACWKGQLSVVKYLISAGAKVTIGDNSGCTPLHKAAQGLHYDVIKYLISRGHYKYYINQHNLTPYKMSLTAYEKIKRELL